MKILSWNLKGTGSFHKHAAIKSTVRAIKPIIAGLIETKAENFESQDIVAFWGGNRVNWEVSPALNNVGGLLLMWDSNAITVENLLKTPRCAVYLLYAPIDQSDRTTFWNQLGSLMHNVNAPMLFMGDFNEVLTPEERKHATGLTSNMRKFAAWVQDLGLVDIKIQNKKFTWMRANSASRINRFQVTHDWLGAFQSLNAYCREKLLSDHLAIILDTEAEDSGPKPFRSLDC
ncbi:hypothetical protein Cgig2_020576 [Carnegiea gigantea]|uniref:Endonuclease/exonuclease/phosphatase domain-containing protein n=1 Tax=Carnegiea gigantea TaxID=171969 RepID=A0A9Q1Q9A3_9CARY|nr:hypothetical protein Cgig2_020576 [Carnegiea gigantea]